MMLQVKSSLRYHSKIETLDPSRTHRWALHTEIRGQKLPATQSGRNLVEIGVGGDQIHGRLSKANSKQHTRAI